MNTTNKNQAFKQASDAGWIAAASRNGGEAPAVCCLDEWIVGLSVDQIDAIISGLGESVEQATGMSVGA